VKGSTVFKFKPGQIYICPETGMTAEVIDTRDNGWEGLLRIAPGGGDQWKRSAELWAKWKLRS
jgi:hypothetical protein